ncbi:kinase-like protein [Neolentinus lepideus HHB14362 ss-1]|uniref:Kinase-like protein n=1 Tax=Neolentinus lepideus HHB14362 ss-1 TaxID=1314782 RepID=A0A165PCB2_9AGAM|nr:kinase-like protein [Neolentinus lepideus HHB14362 ss-1]
MARFSHPNVMPFYGYYRHSGSSLLGIVMPWCNGGNLEAFWRSSSSPQGDKLALMREVAEGLAYLHSHEVVHGDIQPSNILIAEGQARISNFASSRLLDESGFTTNDRPSMRYMAAELINSEELSAAMKNSDVWSLAMTALSVLSGERPFAHIRNDMIVIIRISAGERPRKPSNINGDIWAILNRCWDMDPARRPSSEEVVLLFGQSAMQSRFQSE